MTVKIVLPSHAMHTGEKPFDILTLFILMDYPIYVDTINNNYGIVHFEF